MTTSLLSTSRSSASFSSAKSYGEYATSFVAQLPLLTSRAFKTTFRNKAAIYGGLFKELFTAFIIISLYWNLGLSQESVQNRFGVINYMLISHAFGSMDTLRLFLEERGIFAHEKKNNNYRTISYYLAKLITELPMTVGLRLLTIGVAYWGIGFQMDLNKYLIFLLIITLHTTVCTAYCGAIGALVSNDKAAQAIAPVGLALFMLFGGFFANAGSFPVYYDWVQYFSMFKYSIAAMSINEFKGLEFTCTNQHNINCPIPDGEAELRLLSFGEYGDFSLWGNILMLAVLTVFWRVFAYAVLTKKYNPLVPSYSTKTIE
jgi:ABC-type multidrug transport system permease subunit